MSEKRSSSFDVQLVNRDNFKKHGKLLESSKE